MKDYPYKPHVHVAFRTIAAQWFARVEDDPRGPVNQIVTLMHGQKRIKSALWPVPEGATVRVIRDGGGYSIDDLIALKAAYWRTEYGQKVATVHIPARQPGWRVEVNGKTVLTVTDDEMRPPRPPAPKTPLWTRMWKVLREQLRSDTDWLAGKLGYHRDDECRGWDE